MVNVDLRNASRCRLENAWTHVVRDLLSGLSAERDGGRQDAASRGSGDAVPVQEGASSNVTVWIEERLAGRVIAVTWSDSTRCSYRGQLWRYAIAKRVGRCALSGRPIRRGDAVFRPRVRASNVPLNRDAMILAACVDSSDGVSLKQS